VVKPPTERIRERLTPMKHTIDYSKNLTSFIITGEISIQELADMLDQYLKSGSTRLRLFDISEGILKGLSSVQSDQIIDWINMNDDKRPIGSKTAFIVSRDADPEASRFFHLLTEIKGKTWEARMFHSLENAYEWLNIPQEEPGE